MRRLLFALILWSGTVSAFAEEGWIDVLQGKTLADFSDFWLDDGGKKEATFRLENGVMSLTGTPRGWLAIPGEYRNVSMKLECRFPDPNRFTNSGMLFRITGRGPTFLPPCVELQLQKERMGDLFSFHGFKMACPKERFTYHVKHVTAGDCCQVDHTRNCQLPDKPENWNQVEITLFEDWMIVRVNGQVVNWAYGIDNVPGKIAFQSEGGPMDFRNVLLKVEK
ncbi:MAG: DUF1080 domain-containing protein [Planctomycetia bacterium]|nr:DUF1080 domain-containing protein [Planctomycetia bacterium]